MSSGNRTDARIFRTIFNFSRAQAFDMIRAMPTTQIAHRKTCYFSGHVQGVGFRYTVKNIALRHDVGGYVRNLPDGRVELVMEGPDNEMDELVNEVCDRMS